MKRIGEKKAAIELSIGTIVILVLAMSMLILGLVLLRTIFTSATDNINVLDDEVRGEINDLLGEDKKVAVKLAGNKAEMSIGEDYGVGFGIKNFETGTTDTGRFTYKVEVSDSDIRSKCGINEADAEKWVVAGRTDTVEINPGESFVEVIRFQIPERAPLCLIRYRLTVDDEDGFYGSESFDVIIKS